MFTPSQMKFFGHALHGLGRGIVDGASAFVEDTNRASEQRTDALVTHIPTILELLKSAGLLDNTWGPAAETASEPSNKPKSTKPGGGDIGDAGRVQLEELLYAFSGACNAWRAAHMEDSPEIYNVLLKHADAMLYNWKIADDPTLALSIYHAHYEILASESVTFPPSRDNQTLLSFLQRLYDATAEWVLSDPELRDALSDPELRGDRDHSEAASADEGSPLGQAS